jgi:hypothetical protein
MWTLHRQQQQCGAQIDPRAGKARQPGEAPAEAVADRAAQEHDRADLDAGGGPLQPGAYPASPVEHGGSGNTPRAPEAQVHWDAVVQPERKDGRDDSRPAKGQ